MCVCGGEGALGIHLGAKGMPAWKSLGTSALDHKDHVQLKWTWGVKIWLELDTAILSKLGDKLLFSMPFFCLFDSLAVEKLKFKELFRGCFR